MQALGSWTKPEAGRVTVQKERSRAMGESFPISTVVEITNVELGSQF